MIKASLNIEKHDKPGHNDRTSTENNQYIDKNRFDKDKFYVIEQDEQNNIKFVEVQGGKNNFYKHELKKFREYYKKSLDKQNEKHLKSRHKDRMKSIEDILHSEQTRPDEMILQVGDKDEHISSEELEKLVKEFLERLVKFFGNNIKIYDVAFHNDEATPHCHIRFSFVYHDKDNDLKVGTEKALKEIGIEKPSVISKRKARQEGKQEDVQEVKEIARFDNKKMTFTKRMRQSWYDIIKSHGIEIDTEVKYPSRRHLSLLEYKTQQEQKKFEELEAKKEQLENDNKELYDTYKQIEENINRNDVLRHKKAEESMIATLTSSLDDLKNSEDKTHDDYVKMNYIEKILKSFAKICDRENIIVRSLDNFIEEDKRHEEIKNKMEQARQEKSRLDNDVSLEDMFNISF